MVVEEELERTFLAKYLPKNLENMKVFELEDNYIPADSLHPILRVRRKGDKTVLTKKYRKVESDSSVMIEETIFLSPEEYGFINQLNGKKFLKKRYLYEYIEGKICEIDIYQGSLKGLVVIDFEFLNMKEKENFIIPDFCLVEVTNEEFLAGGMLCGKSYENLIENLKKFNYEKID